MSNKIAIVQSNYIPWKGYFDIIRQADIFVLYDSVQYTKNDWRNRNLIKTPRGTDWLTIPVSSKGFGRPINEIEVSNSKWARKHFQSIAQNYAKSPYFKGLKDELEEKYIEASHLLRLSEINRLFIEWVAKKINIETTIISVDEMNIISTDRVEKLIEICKKLDSKCYISGPSAGNYMNEESFNMQGIAIEWMDYSRYSEYPQLHGKFEHGVTILDVLFNLGDDSLNAL